MLDCMYKLYIQGLRSCVNSSNVFREKRKTLQIDVHCQGHSCDTLNTRQRRYFCNVGFFAKISIGIAFSASSKHAATNRQRSLIIRQQIVSPPHAYDNKLLAYAQCTAKSERFSMHCKPIKLLTIFQRTLSPSKKIVSEL